MLPDLSLLTDVCLPKELVARVVSFASQTVPLKVICRIEVFKHSAAVGEHIPYAIVRTSYNHRDVTQALVDHNWPLMYTMKTLNVITTATYYFARHMAERVEAIFEAEMMSRGSSSRPVRFEPSNYNEHRFGKSPVPIVEYGVSGQDVYVNESIPDPLRNGLMERMRSELQATSVADQAHFGTLYSQSVAAVMPNVQRPVTPGMEPAYLSQGANPQSPWRTHAGVPEYTSDAQGERWSKTYNFDADLRMSDNALLGMLMRHADAQPDAQEEDEPHVTQPEKKARPI